MIERRRIISRPAGGITIDGGGGGGGGGTDVTVPKISVDMPFTHPNPTGLDAVVAGDLANVHPAPTALENIVAVAVVQEVHATPTEADLIAVGALETHAGPTETPGVVAFTSETHPAPVDLESVVLGTVNETHPNPTALETAAVLAIELATPPTPVALESPVVAGLDVHPAPTDQNSLAVGGFESPPAPSPTETVDAKVIELAIHPDPTLLPTVLTPVLMVHPDPTDASRVTVDVVWMWANAVVTNTGNAMANPGNATDKNTTTFAEATAGSSGIGNLTSNTTTIDFVLGHPDLILSDLTIDSVVWTYRYTTIQDLATALNPAVAMSIRYSLNNGGAYTLQESVTAINSDVGERSVDLTSVVAGNWASIDGFRSRFDGTITSGTGTAVLQAVQRFRVLYTRVRIQAHKDY